MKNRLRYRERSCVLMLFALCSGMVLTSHAQLRKWELKGGQPLSTMNSVPDSFYYVQDVSDSLARLYQFLAFNSKPNSSAAIPLELTDSYRDELKKRGVFVKVNYGNAGQYGGIQSILFYSINKKGLSEIAGNFALDSWHVVTNFSITGFSKKAIWENIFIKRKGFPASMLSEGKLEMNHSKESSSSCKPVADLKLPELNIQFKAAVKENKEVLCMRVLSQMLQLRDATFKKRLVDNGLCLEAELIKSEINRPLEFHLKPNPAGVKYALDTFFAELYKMHRFDYSTVAQLELAKQLLIDKRVFLHDMFESAALEVAPYFANNNMADYESFNQTVESITKVDLLDVIKKCLQNKPLHINLRSPVKSYDDMCKIIPNSTPVSKIELYYNNSQTKLADSHLVQLNPLIYTLNLSPSAKVWVKSSGSNKKKALKRAEELVGYLEKKKLGMEYEISFKKSAKNENSSIRFLYGYED